MVIQNEKISNNLSLSIGPFLMKDLVDMVMKKKALPFEDALHYVMSSRMYENLMNENTKTWYLSSSALYDMLEEEKAKLKHLPTSLDEALDALEADHDYLTAGGVFPEELIKNFIASKRDEVRQLAAIPHPAEFDKYYNL